MSLFEHVDYRRYLREWVKQQPNNGRGEFTKMANSLSVNTTLISQVLSGARNFNDEQVFELNAYLGHTPLEAEYFELLVRLERAGTVKLKAHFEKKRESLAKASRKLANRIPDNRELSDQERAVFYSSWLYSAIHLFASTDPAGVTLEDIAGRFRLERARTSEILTFLVAGGLLSHKHGRYQMTTQSTWIAHGSPFLTKHHANWRIKAIQKSENLSEAEIMYSGQVSLSRKDFASLREKFAELLRSFDQVVKDSPAEEVACLNLDWFWLD